jgi:hypothetical protein
MGQELERYVAPGARAALPALTIDELTRVARAMAVSGMFNVAKRGGDQGVASAFVQLLVGQELGISIGQAMSNIHVIDGKPTFSAALMGALVKRHPGYDYRIVESSDERCRVDWFELGQRLDADGWPVRRLLGTSEFSMEDAERAGLEKKDNWRKYPKAMLLSRAMTAGARAYAPDVFNGPVYTPDEIEAGQPEAEIGQIVVEQAPVTQVLEDGSVVDVKTGEVVMPAGSVPESERGEHVEGEVVTEPVEKAPETPAAGETVVDAPEVGDEPDASDAAAEPAEPPRSPVPLASKSQHGLIRAKAKAAGLEADDLLHVVLLATTGCHSFTELPRDDVTQLVGALSRLASLKKDGDDEGWQDAFAEYVAAAEAESGMPST